MSTTKLNAGAVEFTPSKSTQDSIHHSRTHLKPNLENATSSKDRRFMDNANENKENEQDLGSYYSNLFYEDGDNLEVKTEDEFLNESILALHPLLSMRFHDASYSTIGSAENMMYVQDSYTHKHAKCDDDEKRSCISSSYQIHANTESQHTLIYAQDNMPANIYTPSPTTSMHAYQFPFHEQSPIYPCYDQSYTYPQQQQQISAPKYDHVDNGAKLGEIKSTKQQYQEQHELYEKLIEYHRIFADLLEELKTWMLNEYTASNEKLAEIKASYTENKFEYTSSADKEYLELTTSQMAFIGYEKANYYNSDHSKDIEGLEKGLEEMKQIKLLIDGSVLSDIEDIMPWIDEPYMTRIQYINCKMQTDAYFFVANMTNMRDDKNENENKKENCDVDSAKEKQENQQVVSRALTYTTITK